MKSGIFQTKQSRTSANDHTLPVRLARSNIPSFAHHQFQLQPNSLSSHPNGYTRHSKHMQSASRCSFFTGPPSATSGESRQASAKSRSGAGVSALATGHSRRGQRTGTAAVMHGDWDGTARSGQVGSGQARSGPPLTLTGSRCSGPYPSRRHVSDRGEWRHGEVTHGWRGGPPSRGDWWSRDKDAGDRCIGTPGDAPRDKGRYEAAVRENGRRERCEMRGKMDAARKLMTTTRHIALTSRHLPFLSFSTFFPFSFPLGGRFPSLPHVSGTENNQLPFPTITPAPPTTWPPPPPSRRHVLTTGVHGRGDKHTDKLTAVRVF